MSFKLLGAALIIAGCGGVGFKMAATHIKEEQVLRQLIHILDYMECELQYRLTPLPNLCRQASQEVKGVLGKLFLYLADELDDQLSPDVEHCMIVATKRAGPIPTRAHQAVLLLSRSLGRFDIEGQLKGLDAVRLECRHILEQMNENREVRLRSYQTLGLCAGAALAILFI